MAFVNQTLEPNLLSNSYDETSLENVFGQTRFEAGSVEMDEIIACIVINIFIEIFGNGLLVLMIINERHLMDPQKRTAINQIATNMNCLYILNNLIGSPLVTVTIIYNDIGHVAALILLYFTTWVYLLSLFTLVQFTILNLLYINCWNKMMFVNENFLASVCIQSSNIIAGIMMSVKFLTEQHNVNIHYQRARNLFGLKGPLTELYPTIKLWYLKCNN